MSSLISGETLRVLLVSTEEDARDEIGKSLAGRAGDYRLYWVSQPELALVRVQDVLPHVILVDDALEGVAPATLVGQLAGRMPTAAILVLVQPDELAVASQAMLAGAGAFLVRPLDPDDFVATLRQVLAGRRTPQVHQGSRRHTQRTPGRVLCAKGRHRPHDLAINTAMSLRQSDQSARGSRRRRLCRAALDVALNLQRERNIADLLPRLTRLDQDLVSSVLAEHASGIHVLLAPPPAHLTIPITLPQAQHVLAWLKRMFPWVVVDLGLPMDETAFAFLDGSDRIIMSVLPEMIGLRDTRLMLDQMLHRGYPDGQDLAGAQPRRAAERCLNARHRGPFAGAHQAPNSRRPGFGYPQCQSGRSPGHEPPAQCPGTRLSAPGPNAGAGATAREVERSKSVERPAGGLFGRVLGGARPTRA